jgi:hypothetical protein
MKEHAYFIGCLECPRVADEFSEEWTIEIDLIKEIYFHAIESRGIDAGHKVLQIFADPFKPEIRKSREERACRRRWRLACPVYVR